MVVAEVVPKSWDVKILATDLDTNMVEHGERGVYSEARLSGISKARLHRWFLKGSNDEVRVKDELRNMIHFRQLNLLHDWPMRGPMDVIFCRNVIIYFDQETQRRLFTRLVTHLKPDGYLCIGHSESLHWLPDLFEPVRNTIYRARPAESALSERPAV